MLPLLHIQVASIGIPDTLFLMLLALVVFGPRRLPEIGRQIGKLMYEFRKVSNDFKYQMEEELRASEEAERQKKMQADAAARAAAAPPAPEPAPALTQSIEPTPNPELAGSAAEATAPPETVPDTPTAVEGEVRGEPRRFPPDHARIQPPSTGETVAADRPFRAATADSADATSGSSESTTTETLADGTVSTEPTSTPSPATGESSGMEQPAHHA